ncbi:MAG: purine-nucleoside phosphorylase [Brevinematales bacterium]|nr:purine-nucleoside phosphorylase [Brevinematales bacterium]
MKQFSKEKLLEAKESFLKSAAGWDKPVEWAAVMGSGLSDVFDDFKVIGSFPFSDVARMPHSGVAGHRGEFMIAEYNGKRVLAQLGRSHLYEGWTPFEVAFSVGLFGELGIKNLLLTNAAGGVLDTLEVGDVMVIYDQINLQSGSPLNGAPGSEKFQDMTETYDKTFAGKLSKHFGLTQGVYAALRGPHYETPAEVRYLRTIGADAVGMSTVMEAIMGRFYGMRIAGMSLITNKASGLGGKKLDHSEVIEAGKTGRRKIADGIKFLMGE